MYLLDQFLPPVIVAAAVAAAMSMLSAWAWRGQGRGAAPALAAVALGTGYAAGHILIVGWPELPPADTTRWLPCFALAAVVISLFAALFQSKLARLVVLGVMSVAAMRLLLAPQFRHQWSAWQGWLWVGCLASAVLLLALSVMAMQRQASGALESPLLLSIIAAATAGALMLSGSLLLGQWAAVLSAAVLGTLVLACRGRHIRIFGESAAVVFALLEAALLTCGYLFAELPALSAILLAAAPAFAFIGRPVSSPHRASAVRAVLIVAATGGALLAANHASPPWGG